MKEFYLVGLIILKFNVLFSVYIMILQTELQKRIFSLIILFISFV